MTGPTPPASSPHVPVGTISHLCRTLLENAHASKRPFLFPGVMGESLWLAAGAGTDVLLELSPIFSGFFCRSPQCFVGGNRSAEWGGKCCRHPRRGHRQIIPTFTHTRQRLLESLQLTWKKKSSFILYHFPTISRCTAVGIRAIIFLHICAEYGLFCRQRASPLAPEGINLERRLPRFLVSNKERITVRDVGRRFACASRPFQNQNCTMLRPRSHASVIFNKFCPHASGFEGHAAEIEKISRDFSIDGPNVIRQALVEQSMAG